jgi:5-methylcytosine-specific restriction protein A
MVRAKVTPEAFAAAYEAAQRVLAGTVKLTDVQLAVAAKFGIAERTASGYIGCFLAMRRGTSFKTIVSADGIRFMLSRISEVGPNDLMTALESVQRHIMYLSDVTGHEPGLRRVHAEFVEKLREMAEFDDESVSLDEQVMNAMADGPEARAQRLSVAPKVPKQQIVLRKVFKRNPDVIAEVLVLANGVCQSCGQSAPFLRGDGRPYLEVHHLHRLADGGEDTVENAIAVCPNCHRERHYGGNYRDTDIQS